ncbi:MAG: hypothetical protein MK108_10965 [Mariniblastus sp.]|nr:hypothetical protein [Mariniblastus sp.]
MTEQYQKPRTTARQTGPIANPFRRCARQEIIPWLGLLVLLAGCQFGPQKAVKVADYDGHSWTDESGSGVPGIDAGSVTVVTLRTNHVDEISVVFWSDLPADRAGRNGLAGL